MKMYTYSFDTMVKLTDFVNENGIPKENIVTIYQSSVKDFTLVYYGE